VLFNSVVGDTLCAGPGPRRVPRLTGIHSRHRRNALWLHATTEGLFDPSQGRVRPYTVNEIADLWAVTSRTVRYGLDEAIKDQRRLRTHAEA